MAHFLVQIFAARLRSRPHCSSKCAQVIPNTPLYGHNISESQARNSVEKKVYVPHRRPTAEIFGWILGGVLEFSSASARLQLGGLCEFRLSGFRLEHWSRPSRRLRRRLSLSEFNHVSDGFAPQLLRKTSARDFGINVGFGQSAPPPPPRSFFTQSLTRRFCILSSLTFPVALEPPLFRQDDANVGIGDAFGRHGTKLPLFIKGCSGEEHMFQKT
jgi:hypothetical protein